MDFVSNKQNLGAVVDGVKQGEGKRGKGPQLENKELSLDASFALL